MPSPNDEHSRQIVQANRQGVSDQEIAQRHGLQAQHLRDEHPTRHDSAFELEDMPAAIP